MAVFRDGWSQHKQRIALDPNNSGSFFTDQHGRQWHAEVEIKTGDPCGPLRLAEPRHAPWVPTLILGGTTQNCRLLRGQATRGKMIARYDLEILYDVLIAQARQAWTDRAVFKARVKQTHPQMSEHELELAAGPIRGKGALLPVRVFTEAKKGNEYLLGLRPFDPENPADVWLKSYVAPDPITVDDAMADGFPGETQHAAPLGAVAVNDRDAEVARLRAEGKTWKQTADALGITVNQARSAAIRAAEGAAA